MTFYDLTGMRPLVKDCIKLQEKHAYYLGASSSPDLVIVTAVTDDYVTIARYPWRGAGQRIQRPIADDLIAQGTGTWLRQRELRAASTLEGHEPSYIREWLIQTAPMAEALMALVAGQASKLVHDPVAWQRVRATCRPAPGQEGKDLWYAAERHGSMLGTYGEGDGLRYEVIVSREGLDALRADPLFVVETVTEEER